MIDQGIKKYLGIGMLSLCSVLMEADSTVQAKKLSDSQINISYSETSGKPKPDELYASSRNNTKSSANKLQNNQASLSDAVKKEEQSEKYLKKLVDENIFEFLTTKFTGFEKANVSSKGFRAIALSNIAEGLAHIAIEQPKKKDYLAPYLEKLVSIALNTSVNPYKTNLEKITELGSNGLYLSHLNIILGEYEKVAQNKKYYQLNKRISTYLATQSLNDRQKHMRSFENIEHKWPADQAALLYSLYLFDKNYKENESKEPIRAWLEYMKKNATDSKTGLHYSEVTGKTGYSKIPRGCALSWSIRYMSHFAPAEAKDLWAKYKKHFFEDYGLFGGFREWPKGMNRGSDADSGPIINGVGAAATAFGLGAAKAMDNNAAYFKINNAINLGYLGITATGNKNMRTLSDNLLSSAIRFSSENQ